MGYAGLELDGQVAVVIGGTSGIGQVIACGLAEAGADVIPTSRRAEQVESTARRIEALGRRSLRVTSDVTLLCSSFSSCFTRSNRNSSPPLGRLPIERSRYRPAHGRKSSFASSDLETTRRAHGNRHRGHGDLDHDHDPGPGQAEAPSRPRRYRTCSLPSRSADRRCALPPRRHYAGREPTAACPGRRLPRNLKSAGFAGRGPLQTKRRH